MTTRAIRRLALVAALAPAACQITSVSPNGDGGAAPPGLDGGSDAGSGGDVGAPSEAGGGDGGGATCAPSQFSLATPVGFAVGAEALGAAVGDLNGDGKDDVVVGEKSDVGVLLNRGDGTFAAMVTYPVPTNSSVDAQAVKLGDFNGDGKLDVVSGGNGGLGAPLGFWPNNGDGTFGASTAVAVSVGPDTNFARQMVVADMNQDGKLDVLIAYQKFGVVMGAGGGQFAGDVEYDIPVATDSITAGDLNGDHYPDVVIGSASSPDVYVYLNSGIGTFPAAPIKTTAWLQTSPSYDVHSLAVADFDGDGKNDLAVHLGTGTFGDGDAVSILAGKGDGTFAAPVSVAAEGGSSYLGASDLNADGRPDLVVTTASSEHTDVFMNKGDGTFAAYSAFASSQEGQLVMVMGVPGNFLGPGTRGVAALVVDVNAARPGSIKILMPRCGGAGGATDASGD